MSICSSTHEACAKKLLHAKDYVGEVEKRVEFLVDTGRICNVTTTNICKKLGVCVVVEQGSLFGFDALEGKFIRRVRVHSCVGSWISQQEFRVVDFAINWILESPGLKEKGLFMNFVGDYLHD